MPNTDGVATTLGRVTPEFHGGLVAAERLRRTYRRRGRPTSADSSGTGRRCGGGCPARAAGSGAERVKVGRDPQAMPAMASRTIQIPPRSCTWVWMRDSSPV